MKKIFRNMLLMAGAAALALNFASCKGDSEDDNNNEEAVLFTDGDVQYKMSLSELKDENSELSFVQTIEYIKPFDLKEDITFTFKYNAGGEVEPADSVPATDSSTNQTVDKKDLPIVEASMVINCGSDANAQMVRDSMLTDTVSYDITVEGSKVICNYKKETLENMTYAVAESIYNNLAKQLGEQRKKNDANKAKEETDAKKQEAENNRKTNYNFDRDSVGAIISTDSTIEFTLVKAGVAAVYSYKIDNGGNVVSGSVICVCKNSDVAKAYAKEHMKDKNAKGQLIYKSINLDGSNVIMVYSASAIEGLHKRDIVAAQQSGKEPDTASIGREPEPEPEENNGENTENQQKENNNSQNPENEQNENGNNQNPENGQNENNDDPIPQILPEENSNIKPVENEENNNEEPLPHEPIIDNGEGEVVANSIVGRWEITGAKMIGEGVSFSVSVEELGVDYLDFASDGNFSNEWFTEEGEKEADLGIYSINDDVLKFVWDDDEEDLYKFSLSGDTLILYEYCYYVPETESVYDTYDHVPEGVECVRAERQFIYKRM